MGLFHREDPLRDSLYRYLGYGQIIGHHSYPLHNNPIIPRIGSAITTIYFVADLYDKATYQRPNNKKTLIAFGDAFIWQSLATFLLPEFTVMGARIATYQLLGAMQGKSKITSIVGLAIIPIISRPIDGFVNYFLDNTYRKAF